MKAAMNEIAKKYRLFQAKGCSVDQVIDAEKRLGLKFTDEYRNYVLEYGAISFGPNEFTGLNVDEYIDVVHQTLQEREAREDFPRDCVVVQQLGIEGVIIVQNGAGAVFQLDETGLCRRVSESLSSYIQSLL